MLFHLVDSIREVMRDTMKEGLIRHTAPADWENIQASHVSLVTYIDQQDAAGAGALVGRLSVGTPGPADVSSQRQIQPPDAAPLTGSGL